jgi:hypothetical protein
MRMLLSASVGVALGVAAFAVRAQNPPSQPQFPLAAPAGRDSNARTVAPPGAVNQRPFDPTTWKGRGAFDPPPADRTSIRRCCTRC